MKYSVKIFKEETTEDLEKAINYFLKDPSIKLTRISYSVSYGRHYVIITYKHWD